MLLGGLAISVLAILPMLAQQGTRTGEWKAYGGDEGSTRYSPLDQMSRENIKDLRVAWVWKSDGLLPNPATGKRDDADYGQWRSLFLNGSEAFHRCGGCGDGRNDLGLSAERRISI
jgi:hypothetical protein